MFEPLNIYIIYEHVFPTEAPEGDLPASAAPPVEDVEENGHHYLEVVCSEANTCFSFLQISSALTIFESIGEAIEKGRRATKEPTSASQMSHSASEEDLIIAAKVASVPPAEAIATSNPALFSALQVSARLFLTRRGLITI